MPKDAHEVLGIAHGASQDEVRKAYRGLARKHHPDLPGGDEAKFKEIKGAYEALRDAKAPPDTLSPYLTPRKIDWISTDGSTPDPVAVRLSNRGGMKSVRAFGPDQMSGAFWAIDEHHVLMAGDDLCEFLFVPRLVGPAPPDTHSDETSFFVNDQRVTLSLTIDVKGSYTASSFPGSARPKRSPPHGGPITVDISAIDSIAGSFLLLLAALVFLACPFLIMGAWMPHSGLLSENPGGGPLLGDLLVMVLGVTCIAWGFAGLGAVAFCGGLCLTAVGKRITRRMAP